MIQEVDICSVRKRLGLSQEKLAEALGVSRNTVSRWERGEFSPAPDKLAALNRLAAGLDPPEERPAVGEETGSERPAAGEETQPPAVKRMFFAVCALAVCLAVTILAVCVGMHRINSKIDRLLPPENMVRMEDLEGEEVDISSWERVDASPLESTK